MIQIKANIKMMKLIYVLRFETSNTKNAKKINVIKSSDIYST